MPNKTNKELDALISLIDEPNEEMYLAIRNKISDYGIEAIPVLEEAWLSSKNDENAHRLEDLIEEIRFNDVYHELKSWAQFQSNDLIKAFMLISKFRFPDLDEDKYYAELDKLKQDVWLEINDNLTALEKVKVINHVLFDIHHYRGQPPSKKSTLNTFFINELMDTKTGNAITLGIIFIAIAQHLGIPVFGVDLPRHFILAYMDDMIPMKDVEDYKESDILFYLNAMNRGAVFTQNEIELFLKQMKIELKDDYFLPCNNRTIIRRLIIEMIKSYKEEKKSEKAEILEQLLTALD
ncbi:MAG: transglutaminase-like domain-containing protein [Bacteroidetes bacterium]|nr:transglutaminase-like domain-containing protein [Bacteroidota bacterium]